jgi:asparagine synthase (glutamine-hydrolysing)
MSGIAAIWHLDGRPLVPGELQSNIDELRHRSPEGSAIWEGAGVGLGFGRFHTTPESIDEVQPLGATSTSADAAHSEPAESDVVLVMDGRVDDRESLRASLLAAGRILRSNSDAELMLQAYLAWDVQCVERVIGDWALAIWDGRRQRMFFARDPFGSRSIFYWQDGADLVIGSEPQQVQAHPVVPKGLHWGVVGEYLCDHWVAGEETMFAGVSRLLPAEAAVCDREGLRKWQYWPPQNLPEPRFDRPEEYAARFRELMEASIRDRLRSISPVGILLSGGLDSSSIACLTDRMLVEDADRPWPQLQCFSHTYPGLDCDESEYIDHVDRSIRFPVTRLPWNVDPTRRPSLSLAKDFPNVLFDPGSIAGICLHAPEAQALGARVLIDGIGGDELFAQPYPHLLDPLRSGNLPLLWRRARVAGRNERTSPWLQIARHALWPLMPELPKRAWRAWRGRLAPRAEHRVKPWIEPAFAAEWRLGARLRRPMPRTRYAKLEAKNVMATLLCQGYNAVIATEWANLVNARLGIERRHPFLDRRLADFCLAIPEAERVGDGDPSKALLRRAMRGILPREVRNRIGKVAFDSASVLELKREQSLTVDSVLSLKSLEERGMILPGAEARLLSAFRRGSLRAHALVATFVGFELLMANFPGDEK